MSAIIDAQIKTGILRFDTGQYQRPAAFGAGGPKVVDKLKIKRVYHGTDASAFAVEIASQFRRAKTGPLGRAQEPLPSVAVNLSLAMPMQAWVRSRWHRKSGRQSQEKADGVTPAGFFSGAGSEQGRPYISAITSPVATKAFTPVTAMPR